MPTDKQLIGSCKQTFIMWINGACLERLLEGGGEHFNISAESLNRSKKLVENSWLRKEIIIIINTQEKYNY